MFVTTFSGVLSQIVSKDQQVVSRVEVTNISTRAIYDRIHALEKQLLFEQLRRNEEEAKLEVALQQVRQIFLNQRLNQQRCCRQPIIETCSSKNLVELQNLVAELQKQSVTDFESNLSTDLNQNFIDSKEVKKIVNDVLKTYDADKTGRADYALETAGGRVVNIRCTKAYSNKIDRGWDFGWFSTPDGNPEYAIRPGMAPGECWAFQGSVGYLVLELSYPVIVTGFTIEHIAKVLSPTGRIDSAPQHFSVWGLNHADDLNQFLFGEYIYQDNGETVQYFPVTNLNPNVFKFVELKIISNHGHPDYTCLYRIRVHGDFQPK